jgi:hypothetical protein
VSTFLNITLTPFTVTDVTFVNPSGEKFAAYGYFASWIIAGNSAVQQPVGTTPFTNADSYHIFATLAYCPGLNPPLKFDNEQ